LTRSRLLLTVPDTIISSRSTEASTSTLFFFYSSGDHRDLHSFPTRRSSDLAGAKGAGGAQGAHGAKGAGGASRRCQLSTLATMRDRKSTRLNSSHVSISYAVFCLKKKNRQHSRRCAAMDRGLPVGVHLGPVL